MLRSKEINLTESVVVTIEGVRQALEVFFGAEIRFGGPLSIKPHKIRRVVQDPQPELDSDVKESREVDGEAIFRGISPCISQLEKPRQVTFFASLTRLGMGYGRGWELGSMNLLVQDQSGFSLVRDHSGLPAEMRLVAHWEYCDSAALPVPAFPKVKIIQEDVSENPKWRIGFGPHDVETEPFFA